MRRRRRLDIAIAAALLPPPEYLRCCTLPFFVWELVGGTNYLAKQEV
jgi:hypothetical protein